MEVPQEEAAVTEMVPPVVPGVVSMELEEEKPLHPAGSVHV
jgi:hypothetical protein